MLAMLHAHPTYLVSPAYSRSDAMQVLVVNHGSMCVRALLCEDLCLLRKYKSTASIDVVHHFIRWVRIVWCYVMHARRRNFAKC